MARKIEIILSREQVEFLLSCARTYQTGDDREDKVESKLIDSTVQTLIRALAK